MQKNQEFLNGRIRKGFAEEEAFEWNIDFSNFYR